jgi:CheY-like chemotaxis protein
LVNLGINACDAITDRGTVIFNTRLVHLSQEFIKANPWARPGPNIQLDVQDDGGGMTQEVLDRIFDPFFTTKEPGRGTGLGLSVAYSIVERIDGHISAQSVPGQGSLFSIWLPAYKGKAKPRPIPSQPQQIMPGKDEHVLVVDDEPHLREITSEMLSAHGYRVSTAKNGREALELYRSAWENNSPYELVLLDLAMPVMDGQELLNKLKEMDPESKVVVTTGHGAKSVSAKSLTDLADGMLLKPFDMRQLLDIVRRVLGNA